MNADIIVTEHPDPTIPEWMRTAIRMDTGETFLPGAVLYGSDEHATLAAMWDGASQTITRDGHVFMDTDFLLRDNRTDKDKLDFITRALDSINNDRK